MEKIIWKIKNRDIYKIYVMAIAPFFQLTSLEEALVVELLKTYESLLKEASPRISWEILMSQKNLKKIRESLDISSAHFTNIKKSLFTKKVLNEEGFNKKIKLSNIEFQFYEES